MSSQFLISFCNNKKKIKAQTNLIAKLEIDPKTKKAEVINLPLKFPEKLNGNGVTGMCFHQGQLAILLQRVPSTLLFFDTNFKFSHYFELEGLKGVHSILSQDDHIFLSVTNQDRIIKVNDKNQQFEVWSENTLEDTIHLNSICIHNNELYASAFGRKTNKLWSSAQSGFVFKVSNGKQIINNIWHPHSTFSYDNQLYCCNSSLQQVVNQQGVCFSNLPGYTRGLHIDDKLIICGTSQGRLISHSTGTRISNKSDRGALGGVCSINIYFKDTEHTTSINLNKLASEIFDVIYLQ